MSRQTLCLTAVALALLLVPQSGTAAAQQTELSGRVLDPVTDTPVADVVVRLGNRTATTAADGSFSLRLPRRKASHVATSFEAPDYRVYRTWTETGTETEREVYLFPDRDVVIPDIPGHNEDVVSRALFEQHFNVLYRDDFQVGGTLTRWMAQPEILMVDHVIEWRQYVGEDGHTRSDMYATDRRAPAKVLRRLKRAIRESIGPLTNGFLHGDDIRRLRVEPGQMLAESYAFPAEPGTLMVYVTEGHSSGAGLLRDQEIVAGSLLMKEEVFLRPADEYSPLLLLHEFGHALGMYHPHYWPNEYALGTPLCSVVSQMECERGFDKREPTPIDLVTARIAYSRLPGNDRDDVDPKPVAATDDRRNERPDAP